jgi:hypothetical protein
VRGANAGAPGRVARPSEADQDGLKCLQVSFASVRPCWATAGNRGGERARPALPMPVRGAAAARTDRTGAGLPDLRKA